MSIAHACRIAGILLPLVGCTPAPAPPPGESGLPEQATAASATPTVLEGQCQGEDCQVTFDAIACVPLALRAAPAGSAPAIARVAAGDTVHVARTDLHLLRTGLVIVRDTVRLGPNETYIGGDSLRLLPGDTLHVQRYLQLGAWAWLRHGREEGGEEFWPGGAGGITDSSRAVLRSPPEVATWWRVELRDGATGWWRADGAVNTQVVPLVEWGPGGCQP